MPIAATTSAASGAAGFILFLVIGIIGAALYFLPWLIAYLRHVPNTGSVAVINVFLGWTFVGWIVALAMAARSPRPPQVVVPSGWQPPAAPPLPPGYFPTEPQPQPDRPYGYQ